MRRVIVIEDDSVPEEKEVCDACKWPYPQGVIQVMYEKGAYTRLCPQCACYTFARENRMTMPQVYRNIFGSNNQHRYNDAKASNPDWKVPAELKASIDERLGVK